MVIQALFTVFCWGKAFFIINFTTISSLVSSTPLHYYLKHSIIDCICKLLALSMHPNIFSLELHSKSPL